MDGSSNSLPTKVTEKTRGEHSVHDRFRSGQLQAIQGLKPAHPLELSEKNYAANREAMLFRILRDTQGLHAPLRLQMERKITSAVQRLPPLESSMLSFDTLTGDYDTLSIEEIFTDESDVPYTYDVHAAMEKKLKLN